ncbi:MAG: PHP domain-containing protein [Deltaproteobacteria bacterium]|nr:PHP domain-containing protein [Deltaproteobacteria bacterium]
MPSGLSATTLTLAARLDAGVPLRVHVARAEHAGSARLQTIGPREHVELIERATSSRLYRDEVALYADAGRTVVPPELRDDPEAVGAATRGPLRLLEAGDIQGLVHCHTTWSDGRHSVADMVRAAEALGMRYLTITDHSPTASYANGVGLDRIERQWEEIARVQETTKVRILRGAESDILEDGALDYPDVILERLDVVIASIHNRHGQDEAAMTRRLVRAMRHPVRKIWGHPLGRLLLRRPPVPVRFDEVLDAIVESGVIVELNGDPNRMDLPAERAREARRRGVRFVASVDAHAAHETRYLAGAITLARRAGLGPGDVVNTLDAEGFMAAVRPTG